MPDSALPEIRNPRPSLARILAVVAGAITVHVAIIALVRKAHAWPVTMLAAVACAVLIGAVGEWLVHRFVMHRRWPGRIFQVIFDLHHRAHHFVHFTPDRYLHDGPINYVPVWPAQPEKLCESTASRWLSMGAQFFFYSVVTVVTVLLPTAWLARDPLFIATFVATMAAEVFLFVRLHDAVHYPGATWVEHLPGFDWLDRHHYMHHIDTRSNTNFLLPLGDWLFGTLRRRPTPWEAARFPTYQQARQTLIVDEPAHHPDRAARALSAP